MSFGQNISLNGIKSAEKMMQTALNNVSNSKNTSYARERADVQTSPYINGDGGVSSQIGNGSMVQEITRISDELLIQKTRTENGKVGEHQSLDKTLSSIETNLNETGDNAISKLTQEFFNSFEDASSFPEQSSYRETILSSANKLIEQLGNVSDHLDQASYEIDTKVNTEIQKANSLIEKIADINQDISETTNQNPNSMLDRRDEKLDELSHFIDVDVTQDKQNPDNIEVKAGDQTLISGSQSYDIEAKKESSDGHWILSVDNSKLNLNSGSLKGLVQAKNDIIPSYEDKINTFASTMIETVNETHQKGFGLDGSTNMDFFKGDNMRTVKVNDELIQNVDKIALSSEKGSSGNNDIAKELGDIQDKSVIGTQRLGDFYQKFVVDFGNQLENIKGELSSHQDIHNEIKSQKQSVQGVNIDDEITKLNEVQQFYRANAKSLQIANSLLDQVLQIV